MQHHGKELICEFHKQERRKKIKSIMQTVEMGIQLILLITAVSLIIWFALSII